MKILIGDNKYTVKVAKTEEDKSKGLSNIDKLPKDEGMLFIYEEPQAVTFWMKDTNVALDIVFINEDMEVISIKQGTPLSEDYIEEDDVKYVLEVNQSSGIEKGDDLVTYDGDSASMQVLDSKGQIQYELDGKERIFSRKHTKALVAKAAKAYDSKSDVDYKSLGKQMFKYIKIQNTQAPEYV